MPETRRRPFTLLDAIALVAAVAVALAWYRFIGLPHWVRRNSPFDPRNWVDYKDLAIRGAFIANPLVATLTPMLLVLRLRPPRPPLRRLMRRPGATACLAAVIALAARAIEIASHTWEDYLYDFDELRFYTEDRLNFLPHEEGLAVAVVWVVLGVSGRLRAEPTWPDRAGRAVGAFFLACLALSWLMYW